MDEYRIVFKPKCERIIEKLEKNPAINRALEALYVLVRANPRGFGVVPPLGEVYFAKGEYELEDGTTAKVVILYTIIEDDHVVDVFDAYKLDGTGKLVED